MELAGGCVVTSLGGGLCLLSNALFEMAPPLGWRLLERHGLTMEAAPTPGEVWGLDATVMWPYVDLRVAPRVGRARLEVEVRGAELQLAVRGERPIGEAISLVQVGGSTERSGPGVFRHNRILRRVTDRSTGALIEESVIAINRKRLLPAAEVGRSCLTCDRNDCHVRVAEVR
jgi:vancomycin resistance protein VanW